MDKAAISIEFLKRMPIHYLYCPSLTQCFLAKFSAAAPCQATTVSLLYCQCYLEETYLISTSFIHYGTSYLFLVWFAIRFIPKY